MQHFIQYYLRRLLSMPPHIVIKKIAARALGKVKLDYNRKRDQKNQSFVSYAITTYQPLNRLFLDFPQDIFHGNWDWLGGVTRHYLSHRFDLLGSGWVDVHHGMRCRGLEYYCYNNEAGIQADRDGRWLDGRINTANLNESKHVWSLIDDGYRPIDWHLDFKSGYRWCEDTWYKDIKFGYLPGVDVKVPWELARMQQLPQLAWAYALAQRGMKGFYESQRYVWEFRNQVLDFIATNPPRWGVNWACSMDVAIRVANWLVAYDLFKSSGAQFDDEFEKVFSRSIYEHGHHIIDNLEWSSGFRGNHYLSDIVGLLFVSACLPCNTETNAWLAFSVQELVKEVEMQFYEDGGNFEASTSYHRLSAELVIYATALVLGLSKEKRQALQSYEHGLIKGTPELAPAPLPFYSLPNSVDESPFPAWYFLRLERMAEFTMHITRPDGHIPQIGDNDSGRFLKLFPTYERMTVGDAKAHYLNLTGYNELPDDNVYWMEDFLTHRHLVAAINGLFSRTDFAAFAGDAARLESRVIEVLCRGLRLTSTQTEGEKMATQNRTGDNLSDWQQCENLFSGIALPPVVTRFPADSAGLRDGLEIMSYPGFGLYLFRSKRLYLAVRCGPVGQNGYGGHAHNDQLAIELEIDAKQVIIDPGTYNYTAFPDQRNAYRSVRAHFAPHMQDKEPGDISIDEFMIGGNPHATVIYFGSCGFVGGHLGYGNPVYRRIAIDDQAVVVTDFSPVSELSQTAYKKMPFSPAYGIKCGDGAMY